MKREKPILFSGEMVRAILEGRKTQTRRVVKPQPGANNRIRITGGNVMNIRDQKISENCPYGQPGDRLWVRETWRPHTPDATAYRADGDGVMDGFRWRWRPSIHMPRWASRILLEVVAVRVERLQDISEHDAIEEGLFSTGFAAGVCHPHAQENCRRCGYKALWNRIIGPGAWDANPWVWVVEFKVIEVKGGTR